MGKYVVLWTSHLNYVVSNISLAILPGLTDKHQLLQCTYFLPKTKVIFSMSSAVIHLFCLIDNSNLVFSLGSCGGKMPLLQFQSIINALMSLRKQKLTKRPESMTMPPLTTSWSFTGERVWLTILKISFPSAVVSAGTHCS